jgi:thiamine biosynthesis lipoprotein ApbE
MKIYILLLLIIFISLSGCSSLGGLADEGSKSQQEFEITLENVSNKNISSNSSSIATALIDSMAALNNLQKELGHLESEIDMINKNLENIPKNELNSDTLDYLNELNKLTEKSKSFVTSLYDSTKIWDSYLSRQSFDPRELEDLNSTEFSDSIQKPFEVWE